MRFILMVMVAGLFAGIAAKSAKKSVKDDGTVLNKKLIGKAKPAIIAIEIVDPNENKTSKNSKRTVDSSLGYGYQNFYSSSQSHPKYEVYKYSQHDIPPFRGASHNSFTGNHYDIQKSVSYKIPQVHQPNLNNYYQPGTTLFSTVNNQGQIGGLSQQLHQHDPQVPVIILRVFPSQLSDSSGGLHANLPQNHPLASTVNSIDIQALLRKYVQNSLVEANHNQNYQYSEPEQNYQYQYQSQQNEPEHNYQYVSSQQQQHHQHSDGLLTHENYPKDTHTRVIFRTDQNEAGKTPPKDVAIPLHKPTHTYGHLETQPHQMQYSYSDQGQNQGYYYSQGDVMQSYYYQPQTEAGQYYQEQGYEQGYEAPPNQGYEQQNYQEPIYVPESEAEQATPHNYHAHQKRAQRSKKNVYAKEKSLKS